MFLLLVFGLVLALTFVQCLQSDESSFSIPCVSETMRQVNQHPTLMNMLPDNVKQYWEPALAVADVAHTAHKSMAGQRPKQNASTESNPNQSQSSQSGSSMQYKPSGQSLQQSSQSAGQQHWCQEPSQPSWGPSSSHPHQPTWGPPPQNHPQGWIQPINPPPQQQYNQHMGPPPQQWNQPPQFHTQSWTQPVNPAPSHQWTQSNTSWKSASSQPPQQYQQPSANPHWNQPNQGPESNYKMKAYQMNPYEELMGLKVKSISMYRNDEKNVV